MSPNDPQGFYLFGRTKGADIREQLTDIHRKCVKGCLGLSPGWGWGVCKVWFLQTGINQPLISDDQPSCQQ